MSHRPPVTGIEHRSRPTDHASRGSDHRAGLTDDRSPAIDDRSRVTGHPSRAIGWRASRVHATSRSWHSRAGSRRTNPGSYALVVRSSRPRRAVTGDDRRSRPGHTAFTITRPNAVVIDPREADGAA